MFFRKNLLQLKISQEDSSVYLSRWKESCIVFLQLSYWLECGAHCSLYSPLECMHILDLLIVLDASLSLSTMFSFFWLVYRYNDYHRKISVSV